MQKYKPVTTFIKPTQHDALLALADASRGHNKPAERQMSVSRLTRIAVQRLIQDLEEWQDACEFNQHHPGQFLVNGRIKEDTPARRIKFPQCFNESA